MEEVSDGVAGAVDEGDPGVQIFGGELFGEICRFGEERFGRLRRCCGFGGRLEV